MIKKHILNINFSKLLIPFLGISAVLMTASNAVLAQTVSDVTENIVRTSDQLPGLVTGIAYLVGIIFAVYGIIKTKEHVENPNQTALRYPMIALLIGGGMFALPTAYEAMNGMIDGGSAANFDPSQSAPATAFNVTAFFGGGGDTFGAILENVAASVKTVPGIVTAFAYLLGLVFGVAGLLKIKEHVEEPSRTPMKDGIVRLIVGGMLFAIPTIFEALYNALSDDGGIFSGFALGQMVMTTMGITTEGPGMCLGGGGQTLGSAVCSLFTSTAPFPAFLTAMAYLFGLFAGIWGILKIKEHVENPAQVPVWDPISKLLVAGGLFALPNIVTIAYETVVGFISPHTNTLDGQARGGGGGPAGLDGMIAALMNDTFVPVTALVNGFGLIAGFILIFIGISRLMKSAQEGARGPGGIGTLATFVAGGALTALSPMVTSLSASLFAGDGIDTTATGTLRYTAGMSGSAIARAHTVIDAVILFVMLLGFISIVRGIFIMRGVSEGNSQASSMAGVTHMIGGALAVNLGPLLNAVQVTLGIDALGLGIDFN